MKINVFRGLVQLVLLAVFIFLIVQGNVQVWIIVLGAGWVLSLLVGRYYCGWACPMGTLMRWQTGLYHKLGIPRVKLPQLRDTPRWRFLMTVLRVVLLIVFFGGMAAVNIRGAQINLILILVIIGVAISFFFSEAFWHRICPHGAVMNITGRAALWGMVIDEDKCNSCARCEKVCPNQAIYKQENKKRQIENKECLLCYECAYVCPQDAIGYRKAK